MKHVDDMTWLSARAQRLRERLRLECRECEVICERVVSPWQCLRSGCRSIYVFQEGETSYFGCLHKVFLPELVLDVFLKDSVELSSVRDPYGYLRIWRPPLSQCRVTVVQAYESLYSPSGCCNPTFFHWPRGSEADRIRLIVRGSRRANRGSRDRDADASQPEAENPR